MKQIILFFPMLCFVTATDQNVLEVPGDEVEKMKRDCLKYGNEHSYGNFVKAVDSCHPILEQYWFDERTEESIVDRYCRAMPKLARCATKVIKAMEQCLSPEDRDNLYDFKTLPFTIINFICYKERRRSYMVFSEEGMQCMASSSDEIERCFSNAFPANAPSKDTLSHMLDETVCKKIKDVQDCAISEIRKCPKQVFASYLDELMTELRRATPCHKYMSTNSRLTSLTN